MEDTEFVFKNAKRRAWKLLSLVTKSGIIKNSKHTGPQQLIGKPMMQCAPFRTAFYRLDKLKKYVYFEDVSDV